MSSLSLHPDDDDQPQSSLSTKKQRLSTPSSKSYPALSEDELKIELKVYYERLFPNSFLYHWLSSTPDDGLKYREMSFTLPGDVYIRYLSFTSKEALKKRLVDQCPVKIDIGAIYNNDPSKHATIQNFAPIQKELVFDIDMTDYDDVRTCCQEANCWVLMTAAMRVIHQFLTVDFGFKHLLYIFSGRRGIHVWVCDSKAKKCKDELRSAIVEFLSVYQGKEKKIVLPSSGSIHPSLTRSYEILLPFFEELLETQGYMDNNERVAKEILDYFDPSVRGEFQTELFEQEDLPPLQKWEFLKKKVREYLNNSKNGKKYSPTMTNVRTALIRIVFGHVYPRLDVNVSKHLNHLLKSPFCVHPKTGKVCVPINPEMMLQFDPTKVPHILQLHDELNSSKDSIDADLMEDIDGNPIAPKKLLPWQRTSLKEHIEYFKEFVTNLTRANQEENPRSWQKATAKRAEKEIQSNELY